MKHQDEMSHCFEGGAKWPELVTTSLLSKLYQPSVAADHSGSTAAALEEVDSCPKDGMILEKPPCGQYAQTIAFLFVLHLCQAQSYVGGSDGYL